MSFSMGIGTYNLIMSMIIPCIECTHMPFQFLAEVVAEFTVFPFEPVYPFRPHIFPSSTRYFPMISGNFLKISSKFEEHVQIQMHTYTYLFIKTK